MKRKSLKLETLKVQSFVTGMKDEQIKTIKGGEHTFDPVCASKVDACLRTIADVCQQCSCGDPRSTCPIVLSCEHPC